MNKRLFLAIGLALFLIFSAYWYFLVKLPSQKDEQITSFQECVKVYPVITLQYPAKCTTSDGRTFTDTVAPTPSSIGMANPASVYCEEHGGILNIVDQENGQVGMCSLDSGTVCEEWAYYRGECK